VGTIRLRYQCGLRAEPACKSSGIKCCPHDHSDVTHISCHSIIQELLTHKEPNVRTAVGSSIAAALNKYPQTVQASTTFICVSCSLDILAHCICIILNRQATLTRLLQLHVDNRDVIVEADFVARTERRMVIKSHVRSGVAQCIGMRGSSSSRLSYSVLNLPLMCLQPPVWPRSKTASCWSNSLPSSCTWVLRILTTEYVMHSVTTRAVLTVLVLSTCSAVCAHHACVSIAAAVQVWGSVLDAGLTLIQTHGAAHLNGLLPIFEVCQHLA